MNGHHPYTFSIVVLSKNEERNVPFVISSLLQKYTADKITFVLDGDLEPTASILSERAIKFIQGDNAGKGLAIKRAIQRIQSDILVFMDADGSHNSEEIENLLNPLMGDKAEMVLGSRFLGGSEEFSGNINNCIHYVGNLLTNYIINSLWNRAERTVSDANYGFRAIKRSFFTELNLMENGFSLEMEMVIKCLEKGHRILEVPSFELKRRFGQSHISTVHLTDFIRCFVNNMI